MLGKTISHYRIIEKLGAGGQGEVYLAEDSRLDRKVALKILPQHLADRADLRERFEREARAVSSLNHPHICTLYDIGEQDGIHYLVMEHLEGKTLAARLEKGALPLEQTLQYAIQIADALDKAHRQGVVHRDLKPGNIMLTKSGAKLLDFGLAKLQAKETPTNLSALPTEQANLTAEGTILGTLQYMAPEQLEGKEADSRTDIFAFGAVVYEMATGKKAFEGGSQASLIAAIMEKDPRPMSELQSMTPPALDHIVQRCLAKEPDERWQTAADLMAELKWVTEGGSQTDVPAPVVSRRRNRERLTWGLVSLVVGVLVTLVVVWSLTPPASPRTVSRFAMVLPSDQTWTGTDRHIVALSPDSEHLVYVANQQLYLRAMDQLEATPIRGTEGAREPFFSPDGQWVGFWASGLLKKVSISGGAPVTLCEAANPFGASWGQDDTILFGQGGLGILKVPASGGTSEVLITVEDGLAQGPQFLQGGQAVLFTLSTAVAVWDDAQIVVHSLETGEQKVLINGGTDARYSSTGHLVYGQAGTLLAVPFDLASLEVLGGPVPIVEGVMDAGGNTGAAHFSFSKLGSLVYVPDSGGLKTLVWVDRKGQEEPLAAEPRGYFDPRISPDGSRLAITIDESGGSDVWIYDLEREILTRLTFDPALDHWPIWTPDSQRVVFDSTREGGPHNLFWKAADGTGTVQRLTTSPNSQGAYSFSPDGKSLVHGETSTSSNLHVLSMEGEFASQPLLYSEFTERSAAISPSGRYIAYESNESGQSEIYVRPFPNVDDGKWQISSDGGVEPVWHPKGQELFYRNGSALEGVSIKTEPTFTQGSPEVLFTRNQPTATPNRQYDVAPDGQRFLMIKPEQTGAAQINVVLNWFEELKRLVPTDN